MPQLLAPSVPVNKARTIEANINPMSKQEDVSKHVNFGPGLLKLGSEVAAGYDKYQLNQEKVKALQISNERQINQNKILLDMENFKGDFTEKNLEDYKGKLNKEAEKASDKASELDPRVQYEYAMQAERDSVTLTNSFYASSRKLTDKTKERTLSASVQIRTEKLFHDLSKASFQELDIAHDNLLIQLGYTPGTEAFEVQKKKLRGAAFVEIAERYIRDGNPYAALKLLGIAPIDIKSEGLIREAANNKIKGLQQEAEVLAEKQRTEKARADKEEYERIIDTVYTQGIAAAEKRMEESDIDLEYKNRLRSTFRTFENYEESEQNKEQDKIIDQVVYYVLNEDIDKAREVLESNKEKLELKHYNNGLKALKSAEASSGTGGDTTGESIKTWDSGTVPEQVLTELAKQAQEAAKKDLKPEEYADDAQRKAYIIKNYEDRLKRYKFLHTKDGQAQISIQKTLAAFKEKYPDPQQRVMFLSIPSALAEMVDKKLITAEYANVLNDLYNGLPKSAQDEIYAYFTDTQPKKDPVLLRQMLNKTPQERIRYINEHLTPGFTVEYFCLNSFDFDYAIQFFNEYNSINNDPIYKQMTDNLTRDVNYLYKDKTMDWLYVIDGEKLVSGGQIKEGKKSQVDVINARVIPILTAKVKEIADKEGIDYDAAWANLRAQGKTALHKILSGELVEIHKGLVGEE